MLKISGMQVRKSMRGQTRRFEERQIEVVGLQTFPKTDRYNPVTFCGRVFHSRKAATEKLD